MARQFDSKQFRTDLKLSGSFSGSFQGDGSGLTGVTAEWDGSHLGDVSITGSLVLSGSGIDLNVLGNITASGNISSSGLLYTSASEGGGTNTVAMYDTGSGQFFYTASSAIGGGGGGAGFPFTGDAVITGSLVINASSSTSQSLSVIGSGSTIFDVQGSVGQLFSVSDGLLGTLMGVNDISGMPLFQVSSSGLIEIPVGPLSCSGDIEVRNITASGNISASGDLIINDITASSNISASGDVYGVTGSFSYVLGASPLTIESDNFNVDSLGNISGSNISASGTIYSDDAEIVDNLTVGGDVRITGSLITSGSRVRNIRHITLGNSDISTTPTYRVENIDEIIYITDLSSGSQTAGSFTLDLTLFLLDSNAGRTVDIQWIKTSLSSHFPKLGVNGMFSSWLQGTSDTAGAIQGDQVCDADFEAVTLIYLGNYSASYYGSGA